MRLKLKNNSNKLKKLRLTTQNVGNTLTRESNIKIDIKLIDWAEKEIKEWKKFITLIKKGKNNVKKI